MPVERLATWLARDDEARSAAAAHPGVGRAGRPVRPGRLVLAGAGGGPGPRPRSRPRLAGDGAGRGERQRQVHAGRGPGRGLGTAADRAGAPLDARRPPTRTPTSAGTCGWTASGRRRRAAASCGRRRCTRTSPRWTTTPGPSTAGRSTPARTARASSPSSSRGAPSAGSTCWTSRRRRCRSGPAWRCWCCSATRSPPAHRWCSPPTRRCWPRCRAPGSSSSAPTARCRAPWDELDLVRDWRDFLAAPERWLRHLSG